MNVPKISITNCVFQYMQTVTIRTLKKKWYISVLAPFLHFEHRCLLQVYLFIELLSKNFFVNFKSELLHYLY